MRVERQESHLDLKQIEFPTDRVAFGEIRRIDPERFTDENVHELRGDEIGLISAVNIETRLAQKAFAVVAGQPDPCPDVDRLESIAWLHDEYRELGLSSGLRQTRELVLRIEAAAGAQAKRASGVKR